jgi:multidrug transporter EmrE-like cation transporter
MSYLFVALTILLTVYGQLVLKWQASLAPPSPAGGGALAMYVVQMFLRPWVLSGLVAAFLASACWIVAVSRFPLSKIYPFMALNFVLVGLLAVPFFGESLSTSKLAGLLLVIAGLIVTSRG